MKYTIEKYQDRKVKYCETVQVDDWKLKIYTLTLNDVFKSKEIYQNALIKLHDWIENSKNYELPTYKIACLIMHESREGVFCIINWWIGENMMQNHVYLVEYKTPELFEEYSDKGIQFCVWELGIIWYERNSWISNVLKKPEKPDFEGYLIDYYILINE